MPVNVSSSVQPSGKGLRCCSRCHAIYRSDFLRCSSDGTELIEVDEDPLIGDLLAERYVLDACIGEGAMGRVYRSHHARLENRRYAVKILLGDLAMSAAMRIRFAQEAESASQLQHPNVVPVVDFGKTPEGLLYLVMEFVEGPTLAQLIARGGPMVPARVIALARQMCLGLQHAHEHGLIHRDFKPDNVLVVESDPEVARIVDFGLAIPTDPEAARLTQVGQAVGTPIYAAPEQVSGGAVDERADLFALGVTMFEMLAGVAPYDGTLLEILHAKSHEAPPAIAERAPGVTTPPALERFVRTLMSRRAADRFGSAREALAALEAVDLSAPAEPAPLAVAPKRRVGVIALGIAAALAVTAAVVVAFVMKTGAGGAAPAAEPAAVAVAEPRTSSKKPPRKTREADPKVAASTKPAPVETKPTPVETKPVPVETKPTPVETKPAPVETKPTPVETKPAPKPVVLPTDARIALSSLDVRGSLSDAVIKRAVERVSGALRSCYVAAAKKSSSAAAASVRVSFVVDDTRKASSITAGKSKLAGLSTCVAAAMRDIRTQTAPDVGTVDAALTIDFKPVLP
jgi:serine/threonine-protein kinase